jgi:hypothetical protein
MAKKRAAATDACPDGWVARAELEPVPGPQADSVSPGQGAPAPDPRSPSRPGPVMVDRVREATHPRRPSRRS